MIKSFLTFISKISLKNLISPISFIFLWIFLTIFNSYIHYGSFFTLKYTSNTFDKIQEKTLYENNKLSGKFKATEDNLGIVYIPIKDVVIALFSKQDILIFRIKESNQLGWLSENEYRSGIFYDQKVFPFGFPVIKDSVGKTYDFEIVSLRGNEKNAVTIDNISKIDAIYKFNPKEVILKNELQNFLTNKFFNSILDPYTIVSSLFFLLPLILYLFYIFYLKKHMTFVFKNIVYGVFILQFMIVDLRLVNLITIIFLLLLIFKIKIIRTYSIFYSFLLLFSALFFLFLNNDLAEKMLVCAYTLFTIGIIQQFVYTWKK